MADKQNNSDYTADQLQQLDPMDHIRKRIGMYLADNSTRGMTHGLVEIIDNASDEHMAGFGLATEIILYNDGSAEVHDSGRGIPHEINKKTGKSGILLAVGSVGAGGKFGGKDSGYSTSGGLNGVGSAATNATSLRFDVTVYRDGKKHQMSFKQGKPGVWDEDNNPYSKFTPSDKLKSDTDDRTAEQKKKRPTGTTIRWWPDKTVFMPDAEFDVTYIKARAKQTAFLLSGYELSVTDMRDPAAPHTETYKYDGGIVEMLEDAAPDEQLTPTILIHGTGIFNETVPQTNDEGVMVPTEVERTVEVDVAFRWGKEYDYTMKSFVNIVTTPNGGTHVKGFERAISKAITDRIKTNKMLKNNEAAPILDDIREGLTAVVSVKIPEPQFLGQDKTELTSPEANNIVNNVVLESLSNWMDNRKNLNQAKLIMQKTVNASRVRLTQKQQRETARKKNALESSSMPAKLVDCLKNSEDSNELLICEGDSALGGLRSARDSMYQALFPIRGKILNVHKATLKQVLDNAECSSIIQVVGGGVGNSFDLDSVRYSRVIFASVAADEYTLINTPDGFKQVLVGDFIDSQLGSEVDSRNLNVSSYGVNAIDVDTGLVETSSLKGVIRHPYTGIMRNIKTVLGKSIDITANHSVFTFDDGKINLREGSTLNPGDVVLIPKKLPQSASPILEIDLLKLLIKTGHTKGLFVENSGVRKISLQKAAERKTVGQSGHYPLDQRVILNTSEWSKLIQIRILKGLTQKNVAKVLGYAQPISVSQFEKGMQPLALTKFHKYLELLESSEPKGINFTPSLLEEQLQKTENSGNKRFSAIREITRISDLTIEDLNSISREAIIYAHGNNAKTKFSLPRFMPMTEELAEFLGWYSAEGSLSRSSISLNLGAGDNYLIPHLKNILKKITGQEAKLFIPEASPNSRKLTVHSLPLTAMLKALNATGLSYTKKVPDVILNSDEGIRLSYLKGLYLGDDTKTSNPNGMINLVNTISKQLANGVSTLLLQSGIVSSVTVVPPSLGSQIISKHNIYRVNIFSNESLAKLHKVWETGHNSENIKSFISSRSNKNSSNTLIDVSKDFYGVEIKHIEDREVKDLPVYDFSVKDKESFISGNGGGIACHNSDADADGSHIRALLITLFARYMKPIIDDGRLYTIMPPLYKIKVGGRNPEDIYALNDEEKNKIMQQLEKDGRNLRAPLSRLKGLGEMQPDDLWITSLDPATRNLRQITWGDVDEAHRILDLAMGADVASRKEWIMSNRVKVDELDF